MSTRTAVTFLEYWKRTNATISYYWDCYAIEEAEVSIHVVHIVISVIIIVVFLNFFTPGSKDPRG